jgi:hypothetical protein
VSLNEQAPPYPGQHGHPATPPPAPRTFSGLAIAGFILVLIPPIGFLLSLIAIFRTGRDGKRGRGLAVAGVILSTLLMVGGGALVYVASQSTLLDPGCTAGKEAVLSSGTEPVSFQKASDDLKAAAAKAKNDDVRQAMTTMADDYSKLVTGMKTGEIPAGLEAKVTADAERIDELCTLGG